MRIAGYIVLAVLPLMLAARQDPPEISKPEEQSRNFTINGASLAIYPGETSTFLQFSGGVTCVADNMVLTTDVLEINVRSSDITGGQQLKLPQMPDVDKYEVENPSERVKEMAKELQVPSARFSTSAIERVGAAGKVKIKAGGMSLSTEELVSTDGGRSWAANGRSTLNMTDQKTGDAYEISADQLLYDIKAQRALARGGISGRFLREDMAPVELESERLEIDIEKSQISVTDYLLVRYESLALCCGSLEADLANNKIQATNTPKVRMEEDGLVANMGRISFDLDTQVIVATGGVQVTDTRQNITLEARQVTANLLTRTVVATGQPVLQHGESMFTGEKVTLHDEDGKTVIEVTGPQHTRLDLENLPDRLKSKKESPPDETPGELE